jgi:hypothetical protein
MTGNKRSHDATFSEDVGLSSLLDTTSAQPRSAHTPGDVDGRQRKKSKRTQVVRDALDERRDEYARFVRPSVTVQATENASDATVGSGYEYMTDGTLVVEEGNMSDGTLEGESHDMSDAAPDTEDEDVLSYQQQAISATAAISHGQPSQFVLLHPILACDIANKFAPTYPTTRQSYLDEVGRKQLHPTRTPLDTPNSAVAIHIRHAIYERLFLGMSNTECIPNYNKHGGRANGPASVSKQIMLWASKWFEEENVVLPWLGHKKDDQRRLIDLGLTPENFPSPHATRIAAGTPSNALPVAKTRKPKSKQIVAEKVTETLAVNDSSAEESDGTLHDLQEDEASDSESEEPPQRMWDHRKYRLIPESNVLCEKENPLRPNIHVVTKAAMNAFDIEEDATTACIVNGRKYMAKKDALFEHCGFVRAAIGEAEDCPSVLFPQRDPAIVRGFIQAISPSPERQLPTYDIEFLDTTTFHKCDGADPLGIIYPDNVIARKIFWDIEACKDMYSLASAMNCPVVKAMVTDRVYGMFMEERKQKRTQPHDSVEEFDLPIEFLQTLTLEKDAKFITLICTFYYSRLPQSDTVIWPEIIPDDIIDYLEAFDWGRSRRTLEREGFTKMYCERHHLHRDDEPCHMVAGEERLAQTDDEIAQIFAVLRSQAYEKNYKALKKLEADKPEDIQAHMTHKLESELVQWSLTKQECIADIKYEIEMVKQKIGQRNASDEEKGKGEETLEVLGEKGRALREEYYSHWEGIDEKLEAMRNMEEFEDQQVAGVVIYLEPEDD